jgi:hypothetical protein
VGEWVGSEALLVEVRWVGFGFGDESSSDGGDGCPIRSVVHELSGGISSCGEFEAVFVAVVATTFGVAVVLIGTPTVAVLVDVIDLGVSGTDGATDASAVGG